MLLVQDPKLLLLDEPVAGMTNQEREKTGELLHALEGRHTVIITSTTWSSCAVSHAR